MQGKTSFAHALSFLHILHKLDIRSVGRLYSMNMYTTLNGWITRRMVAREEK